MACSKCHLEAVVFSKCVCGTVAFLFSWTILQQAVFLLLHCKHILILPVIWGRMDGKQLLGSDPWLARWLHGKIHVLLWSGNSGEKDIYVYMCVRLYTYMCVCVCVNISEKITSLWEYFTAIRMISVLKLIDFFSGDQMLSPLVWGSITNTEVCRKVSVLALWYHL